MPDKPKTAREKQNTPATDAPSPDDACESNLGQPGQTKDKPECPDGYPDEQPPADAANPSPPGNRSRRSQQQG